MAENHSTKEKQPVKCALCPASRGSVLPTSDGRWVHTVCCDVAGVPIRRLELPASSLDSTLMAGTAAGNAKVTVLGAIGADVDSAARGSGSCYLCNRTGALLQCKSTWCKKILHVSW